MQDNRTATTITGRTEEDPVAPEVRRQIRAALDEHEAQSSGQELFVLRQGDTLSIEGNGEVIHEDGQLQPVTGSVPGTLPLGYHRLERSGRAPARLIVCPPRCHWPEGYRNWGWAIQLYSTRSASSWGIGDLRDLASWAAWARDRGAGALLTNPLWAASPGEASPYSPTTRRYRNPLYVCIADVPGAQAASGELQLLERAARRLNEDPHIDRDAVHALKMNALKRLWERFSGETDFEAYRLAEGDALRRFSLYCALAEQHGWQWNRWPAALQRSDAPAVRRFAEEHEPALRFHAWVQWVLERQWRQTARHIGLWQDLPVGFDPHGFDAWEWQHLLAPGLSVGAPPDQFNAQGQNWGLPAFVPSLLRGAGYEPLIATLRASMRYAEGLRIDHVMGLFRLWLIPEGRSERDGAYVSYPADELLSILALESHRARVVIVGEDLGTVEDTVREEMARRAMLSYKVLLFEEPPPEAYPELALGAVSTHDLPTIAGVWTGADVKAQRRMGLPGDLEAQRLFRQRLRRLTGLSRQAPVDEAILETYRRLGQSQAAVLLASLEDAAAVTERPNQPGAKKEQRNWSRALPVSLEELQTQALPSGIARALAVHGRSGSA
jgi:4-alpha-glucanotransferase